MGTDERKTPLELKESIFQIFKDFMTGITKLEEKGNAGSRFLLGFQQGLGFLQRPPINCSSKLIETIIRSNETRRLKSYVETGCINSHDAAQRMKMSKSILNDLECLLEDATNAIESANKYSSPLDKETSDGLYQVTTDKDEMASSCLHEPEVMNYAALMAIIYSMLKQNHVMQEKIITSLGLKSSLGELETYTLMWALRPFAKDELLNQAWKLIP